MLNKAVTSFLVSTFTYKKKKKRKRNETCLKSLKHFKIIELLPVKFKFVEKQQFSCLNFILLHAFFYLFI